MSACLRIKAVSPQCFGAFKVPDLLAYLGQPEQRPGISGAGGAPAQCLGAFKVSDLLLHPGKPEHRPGATGFCGTRGQCFGAFPIPSLFPHLGERVQCWDVPGVGGAPVQ